MHTARTLILGISRTTLRARSTTRILGSTSYVVGRRLYEWMAGSWIFENEENTRFFFSVRHEDISSPITPPDNVDLELDKMA